MHFYSFLPQAAPAHRSVIRYNFTLIKYNHNNTNIVLKRHTLKKKTKTVL